MRRRILQSTGEQWREFGSGFAVCRMEIDAHDAPVGLALGVGQAVSLGGDGWACSVLSADLDALRSGTFFQPQAPEGGTASAVGGKDDGLAVGVPGEALNGTIVKGYAANVGAVGLHDVDIANSSLDGADEGDAGSVWRKDRVTVAIPALGRSGDAVRLQGIESKRKDP